MYSLHYFRVFQARGSTHVDERGLRYRPQRPVPLSRARVGRRTLASEHHHTDRWKNSWYSENVGHASPGHVPTDVRCVATNQFADVSGRCSANSRAAGTVGSVPWIMFTLSAGSYSYDLRCVCGFTAGMNICGDRCGCGN